MGSEVLRPVAVDRGEVAIALATFAVAQAAYLLSVPLYEAYLPAIATPQSMARVSGFGWAIGFAGGSYTYPAPTQYVDGISSDSAPGGALTVVTPPVVTAQAVALSKPAVAMFSLNDYVADKIMTAE